MVHQGCEWPSVKRPPLKMRTPRILGPAFGFAARGALEPAAQVLEDHKGGEIEGDDRRGADAELAPERLDQVGPLRGREAIVDRHVGIAHSDIVEEQLGHGRCVRQVRNNARPAARAVGEAGQEADGARDIAFSTNEDSRRALVAAEGAARRVTGEPFAAAIPGGEFVADNAGLCVCNPFVGAANASGRAGFLGNQAVCRHDRRSW